MANGCKRDHGDQEDDRQPGQQDVERDLVRRLLPLGAFDERDHPVEERLARIDRDLHPNPVREHLRAAGHGGAIAARLADDRRRFAGDGAFVDRRNALDDVAVGGDHLAGRDSHDVPFAERRCRHDVEGPVWALPVGHRLGLGPSQRISLRLAASLGHRFGEVGKEHGQPEPERDLKLETQPGPACRDVANEPNRGEHAADFDDEHHRVARHRAWVELPERVADRASNDLWIPDGFCLCSH